MKYIVEVEGEAEELVKIIKALKGKAKLSLTIETDNGRLYAILNRHYNYLIKRRSKEV